MKRILAMVLSLAIVAGLAITGTVAYLQDSEGEVNTMTLGNVYIEQHEYQRAVDENGDYKTDTIDGQNSYVLEDFTQAKPLYPAIIPNGGTVGGVSWGYDAIPVRMSQVDSHGGADVFNTPNAQDKFITVENIGKSDAYVRTLIALEVGSAQLVDTINFPGEDLIVSETRAKVAAENIDGDMPWTYGFQGYVEINGNNYLVLELIYTGAKTQSGWKHEGGILPAGETTYPSLCQVYMASRATNEDCEALDGNKNGTYDILTLSQAVQAAGWEANGDTPAAEFALDTAFGDVTATNVQAWFGDMSIPTSVATAEELRAALAEGKSVALTADINDNEAFVVKENATVTLDLNGHTLTSKDGGDHNWMAIKVGKGANLTLKGDGKIVASCYGVYVQPGASFTMESGEIIVRGNGSFDHGVVVWNGGTFTMNGGKITASVCAYAANDGGASNAEQPKIVINDGELVKEKETNDLYAPAYIATNCEPTVVINGGTFDGEAYTGSVTDYVVIEK
ncbi:MAG: hypothetical protein IJ466_05230 [Clostridia bacterium]|nr:hypothetical protein [Clostridia bacterium]